LVNGDFLNVAVEISSASQSADGHATGIRNRANIEAGHIEYLPPVSVADVMAVSACDRDVIPAFQVRTFNESVCESTAAPARHKFQITAENTEADEVSHLIGLRAARSVCEHDHVL